MLGKLLKYEFRATARIFLPMYAILLVMSAAARLLYGAQMISTLGSILNILTAVVTVAVIGLMTAVAVVTVVLICRRFWTNLLGREGYLMNVLPVTSTAHVWAKLIAAAVWTILSGVVCMAALFIMLSQVVQLGSFQELAQWWNEVRAVLAQAGIAGWCRLLIAQFIFYILLSLLLSVLEIYAAMSVGQLVNRHRIWMSVGAYFGIEIVRSTLMTQLVMLRALRYYTGLKGGNEPEFSFGGTFDNFRTALPALNLEALLMILFTLLFCAGLFFLTRWILKRHLNLQ